MLACLNASHACGIVFVCPCFLMCACVLQALHLVNFYTTVRADSRSDKIPRANKIRTGVSEI